MEWRPTGGRGFTLYELLAVVAILAILAILALPDPDEGWQAQGETAGRRFQADVDFARTCTIARPDDPIVVTVDLSTNRYWLAKGSDATRKAITHPATGKPYVVRYGVDPGLQGVSMVSHTFGTDNELGFDSVGALDQSTAAKLTIKAGHATYDLAVSPAAAEVKIERVSLAEPLPTDVTTSEGTSQSR